MVIHADLVSKPGPNNSSGIPLAETHCHQWILFSRTWEALRKGFSRLTLKNNLAFSKSTILQ